MSPRFFCVAAAVLGFAPHAFAQTTTEQRQPEPPVQVQVRRQPAPPRTWGGAFGGRRPLDPNKASTQFEAELSTEYGYDQAVDSEDPQVESIQPFSQHQSGHITVAGGNLRYRVGTAAKFMEASGMSTWSHATSGARDMTIGEGRVRATTNLGKKTGLSLDTRALYQPTFLFNALGPSEIGSNAALSGTTAGQGITQQFWRTLASTGRLDRRWTTRQTTEISYTSSAREPVHGIGFDSHSKAATWSQVWNARELGGFDFNYRFDENRQSTELGAGLPVRYHSAELGVHWRRRRESFGNAEFAIRGGATYTTLERQNDRPRAEFVEPAASGSFRFAFSRTANVTLDARRNITVLDGLSPEPFSTDTAMLVLQGQSFKRLQTILTGAYSHGFSTVSDRGEFEMVSGILEFRVRASRHITVFARGNYYKHQLDDVLMIQPGFPGTYELGAARVGLTLRLPLYGTFVE